MEVDRQEIKQRIRDFVAQPSGRSLAINGPWGVGKTFLWDECMAENLKFCRSYSYVSLFGLRSIEESNTQFFQAWSFGTSRAIIDSSKCVATSAGLSAKSLATLN